MSTAGQGTADGPVAKRYQELATKRQPYIAAAEAAARLSIPSLFPSIADREHADRTKVVTQAPWQNTGSRGVNNLASKLLITLLPPNQPFFRFLLDDDLRDEISEDEELKATIEAALQKMERQVMEEVEANGMRVDTFEALRQLIVAGNVLIFIPVTGQMKLWDMSQYVVKRDHRGTVLEIVIREAIDRRMADPRIKRIIEAQVDKDKKDRPVFLYTKIVLKENGRYESEQEVCGQKVPGSFGVWRPDQLPFLALRFRKIEGEDWGRGLIEENIGDLKTLESLTQSVVEASAAAAKVLFGVKPGAQTNPRILAKLANGQFFKGNPDDVWTLQLDKQADLQVAQTVITELRESLAFIFLLNSAVQRNGERVTAEEIRFMAGELEDTLGGVYSILSQEFQLPLVRRLVSRMQRAGRLPTIPEQDLRPTIVTGLEAIGRGQDITRIRGFAEDVKVLAEINPAILEFVKERQMLLNIATARGVDVAEFVKTEEEVAAERQAAQQAKFAQDAGAAAAQGLGKGVEQASGNLANTVVPGPDQLGDAEADA